MSRQCPERHHLFLNWLQENRNRFTVQPQITGIRNRQISGTFQGLNPALRLQVYHRLINLDVIWKGRYYGAVTTFLVADKRDNSGLKSLVIRDCYEGLLVWCNQNLDSKSWIALYQYSNSGLTLPRLQHTPEQEEGPERLKLLCALPLAKQRS